MTQLVALPKPEYDRYNRPSRSSYSYLWSEEKEDFCTTPYRNPDRAMTAIAERGIKMPFTAVITKADGFSTCPHCNSLYVGYEKYCQKLVPWVEVGSTFNSEWRRLDKLPGENIKNQWNEIQPIKTRRIEKCGELTKWSLDEEFRKQERFFSFVDFVYGIQDQLPMYFEEFSPCLPPGSVAEYRIRSLEQQLEMANITINAMGNAIHQIAEKMNNAGAALSFNFR